MSKELTKLFEEWMPVKPAVLSQTKHLVELSFKQPQGWYSSLGDILLYKVQTKTKMLGWVNIYCGGKTSKIIDNLQPGMPHTFRLKIILRFSKLQYLFDLKIKKEVAEEKDNAMFQKSCSLNNNNINKEPGHEDESNCEAVDKNIENMNLDLKEEIIDQQFENKSENINFINKNDIEPPEAMNFRHNLSSNESLNNGKNNQWIESEWSEELTACSDSEGPTVVCFCMAVRCGYMKQVQAMLEERPSLIGIRNTIDGFTPLATAVRKGNIQMVKYLLNSGADVNQRSSTSQTPLHLSVLSANVSLTELLVDRGADIKCRDANGLSVMHYAADSGDLPTLIYAFGIADLNDRDNKGWTALHRAVMQGASTEVVQELMTRGCEPEARDLRGLHCAQLAAMLRRRDDIRRLVDKNFVHDKALTNFTKLTKKLSTIHTLASK